MEITQVKIFPVQEDKLKAFVSVVFDHCFMVNDIKVIQGKDGLFLSMPSRRKKSGEFKDVAHPLNNETRRLLEERVLREYRLEVHDPTPRRPDRVAPNDARSAEAPQEARTPEGRTPTPEGRTPTPEGPTPTPKDRPPTPDGPTPKDRTPKDRTRKVPEVASPVAAAAASEKTLEEVQEKHLSDSFWSVS